MPEELRCLCKVAGQRKREMSTCGLYLQVSPSQQLQLHRNHAGKTYSHTIPAHLTRHCIRSTLLNDADGFLWSYPLTFFYNRRPVVRLGSPLLLFCDEQLLRNPAWAYVDETWSSERRFSFYEKQRRNRSFARAARATLEARDSLLDPLYVAIFIALAQRLRETRQPSEPGMSQTVCPWPAYPGVMLQLLMCYVIDFHLCPKTHYPCYPKQPEHQVPSLSDKLDALHREHYRRLPPEVRRSIPFPPRHSTYLSNINSYRNAICHL